MAIETAKVRSGSDFRRADEVVEVARLRRGLVHESRRIWPEDRFGGGFRVNQLHLPGATGADSLALDLRNRSRDQFCAYALHMVEPCQPQRRRHGDRKGIRLYSRP